MILEYYLALSNLTSTSSPMEFPQPFVPYPKEGNINTKFFIPWYLKIEFLRENIEWSEWLSMGITSMKLNGLWIDYTVMTLLQIYFIYFNCQLFSLKYKINKGAKL